jgi:hypothetical protein
VLLVNGPLIYFVIIKSVSKADFAVAFNSMVDAFQTEVQKLQQIAAELESSVQVRGKKI